MRKILIFGMSDNMGGVETAIMSYYRLFDKSRIQCDFLYNTENIVYEDEIKKRGGKLYKITPRSKSIIKYKKDMKKFFSKHANEYDAIWINLCTLCNIDWLKYSKRYNIPNIILHSHNSRNMVSKAKFILHKINKNFISNYATEFWACSKEAGKFFYNKNILDKLKIINNAIDLNIYKFDKKVRTEYRDKLNLNDKFVIGHVGRFHFQKNQEFLIEIFSEVVKRKDNAHLLLIGKGEDENKIKYKVKEMGLEDKVSFLGSRKDIINIYQAMDIFLLPSKFEGLPLVVLEAQANGLDIYASKEGIPIEAKVSNNFYFISLKESAEKWAKQILFKTHVRENNIEKLKVNGFDIETEAIKMQDFFENKFVFRKEN